MCWWVQFFGMIIMTISLNLQILGMSWKPPSSFLFLDFPTVSTQQDSHPIHCAGRKEPVPAAGSISWVISEHPRSYPVIAVPWTHPNVAGVLTNISRGFLPELYRCGDGFSCGRTPPRRWKREGTRMAHTSQNWVFTPLMIQIWHMWSHSNPSQQRILDQLEPNMIHVNTF